MDLDELPHGFLQDVRDLCADLNPDGHIRSREALDLLGVDIVPGPLANYYPAHPFDPDDFPAVMLPYHQFGWTETNTLRHELWHALVDATGHSRAVLEGCGHDKRRAQPLLEQMALVAGAFWAVPQGTVDAALRLFPLTGDTAMLLTRMARITPEQAMVRLVFNDSRCAVAGFVVSGGLVTRTATCNASLPFGRYQRLPTLPDGVQVSRVARWQVGIVA